MGWSTGSGIAESLWKKLRPFIESEDFKEVTKIIVDEFTEHDADDWEMYPSNNCLMYVYMKTNEPEELEEYDFGDYVIDDEGE